MVPCRKSTQYSVLPKLTRYLLTCLLSTPSTAPRIPLHTRFGTAAQIDASLCFRAVITYFTAYLTLIWYLTRVLSFLRYCIVRNVLYCTSQIVFSRSHHLLFCPPYGDLVLDACSLLSAILVRSVLYCTRFGTVFELLRRVFAYGTAYVDSVPDVHVHSISTCFCVFFVPTT
jgi:hypothetical protein